MPAQQVSERQTGSGIAGLGSVVPGVLAMRQTGLRLATLSNGSEHVAEHLLRAAGVRDDFEALLC